MKFEDGAVCTVSNDSRYINFCFIAKYVTNIKFLKTFPSDSHV